MNQPKIDLSELPDLKTPSGVFGSTDKCTMNDSIVILMAYIFEIDPPAPGG